MLKITERENKKSYKNQLFFSCNKAVMTVSAWSEKIYALGMKGGKYSVSVKGISQRLKELQSRMIKCFIKHVHRNLSTLEFHSRNYRFDYPELEIKSFETGGFFHIS